MVLYHGSNVEIIEPRLLKKQRNLDFGKGFYTTSDRAQALRWAERTVQLRGEGVPLVSVYKIAEEDMKSINIHRFPSPDIEWLNYVTANRKGTLHTNDYDLVIGPVANDQTFPTILLYLDGYLSAEATIQQLLPQKLRDQYVFKTEKSLSILRYSGVIKG